MGLATQIGQIRSAEVRLAEENAAFLRAMGISMVHLLASPGAGKTTLILRTAETLGRQLRLAVIQGGLSRQIGTPPLSDLDLPTIWIDTGGQPYLDASMIREALEELPIADVDLLLVEEIGTLTSPPKRSLGASLRVVIASLPEGADCPLRYPEPFSVADAVVLNKLDLLPHLEFDLPSFHKAVRRQNSQAPIFELSCRTGKGLKEWSVWLLEQTRSIS
jgi:hydrogenase nickel incorporation protein HypB